MLNQTELNFYGFNPNNIIQRENRGKISVSLCYDANNYLFVVTRRTPKTCWQDRYTSLERAKERYNEFLYSTNTELERKVREKING